MTTASNRRFSETLLIVTSVLMAVLYAVSPMYLDDFWYLADSHRIGGDLTTQLKNAFITSWEHTRFDTGRLVNLISPIFTLLMPRWLYAILTGCCIYYSLVSMIALAHAQNSVGRSALIVFCYIFMLPWAENMLCTIFSLNYVWVTAFSLWFLRTFFKADRPKVLICILALIAGWMHEGFSIPILAGCSVFLFLQRKNEGAKNQLILLSFFLIGFIILLSFPATWKRMGHFHPLHRNMAERMIMLFSFCSIAYVYVYVITFAWAYLKKKLVSDNLAYSLFFLTCIAAAYSIYIALFSAYRLNWFLIILSSCGIVWLLGFFKAPWRRKAGVFTAIAVAILTLVHLSACIVRQISLTREFEQITALALKSPNGTVYYDNQPMPLDITLFKTTSRAFNDDAPIVLFSRYYFNDGVRLNILPTCLREFRIDDATPVASEENIFLYKNLLVSNGNIPKKGRMTIHANGFDVPSKYRTKEFVEAFTGDTLLLIDTYMQNYFPGITIEDAKLAR